MADPILPRDLPAAPSVPGGAAIIIDNGVTVQKATPAQIGDTARPFASQAEAEAGGDNTKTMTPLRVRQAIDSQAIGKAMAAAVGIAGDALNLGAMGTSLVDDHLTVKQAFESAGDNLFAPTGAALIGSSAGSGATARTVQDALRDFVYVESFGAVGDGVTDDSAAFTAAANHLVTRFNGGIIRINSRYRIGSDIIIPNRVIIEGCSAGRDNTNPSTEGDIGATLVLPNSATLILRNGSGVRNVMIREASLVFNQTSAQVAANFLGTAITLATNTTGHVLENLFILGFNQAIKSQDTTTVGPTAQNNRTRIFNVLIDCINGVWLHNCYDIPYLNRIHCWPYTTVASVAEANSAQLKRSGVGIRLSGTNDWTKVTDSFTYGYAVGAQVTDARSVTFVSVSHDHPPGSTDGSKGYFFEGVCAELRVIGGQVAGKEYGAHVYSTNAVARIAATFTSVGIWKTTTQALRIQAGIVQVNGGFIRNDPDTTPNGIGIKNENTGAAEITITGVDFAGLASAIENESSVRVLRYANCTFRACNVQITNAYVPSIASSATIAPNGVDEAFTITGTTNIGSVSSPQRYAGRRITLTTASALSILTSGNIRLKDNVNFIMAAGDTLTLLSDGTNWYEVARAQVNAWVTSFVPTITATTGTITTSSATCQYRREGALVVFSMNIAITTNGTGAGTLRATLPFSAAAGNDAVFVGRDRGVGGKTLTATLVASGNTIDIKNYDNTYPAADGSVIMVTGSYRAS